jgi:ferritin-like metal-binding protein YciE
MDKLETLQDLFHHQLKDIYSAETQLAEALPTIQKKASNDKLKEVFADHLKETKNHISRLNDLAEEQDLDLTGETCKAMQGLIKEAKSFISEDATPAVRDAGIIADVQRIEHYKISAYGTVVQFAMGLKEEATAEKLQQSLDEVSAADEKLNEIAVTYINHEAKKS